VLLFVDYMCILWLNISMVSKLFAWGKLTRLIRGARMDSTMDGVTPSRQRFFSHCIHGRKLNSKKSRAAGAIDVVGSPIYIC